MKNIIRILAIILIVVVNGISQVPPPQPAPTANRPRPGQRIRLKNPNGSYTGSYVQLTPQPHSYPRVSASDIRLCNGVKYNTKRSVLWENSFGQFLLSGLNVLHHSTPYSNGMVYTFTTFVNTGIHVDITQLDRNTWEGRSYEGAKQVLASRHFIQYATTNNINNETRLMRIGDVEYKGKLISAWTIGLPYTAAAKH